MVQGKLCPEIILLGTSGFCSWATDLSLILLAQAKLKFISSKVLGCHIILSQGN